MGAKQSTHTNNTFIHVNSAERGIVDDSFVIDSRLTRSSAAAFGQRSPFNSTLQQDHSVGCATLTFDHPDNLSYVENFAEDTDPLEPRKVHIPSVDDLNQELKTTHTKLSLSACLSSQADIPNLANQAPKAQPYTYVQYGYSMQNVASAPMGPVLLMQPQPQGPSRKKSSSMGSELDSQLTSSRKERVSDASAASTNKKKSSRSMEKEARGKSDDAKANDSSTWTSRMLRNLPNDYSRNDLLDLLDALNVQYDFVYLPVDWGKKANLGYAFVNLVCPAEAERIYGVMNGFSAWSVASEKVCEVVWGKPDQQSLRKNVERFRNSPVMHPDVPDEFKPMIFTLGKRSPFPAPTKRLRPPRGFNRKVGAAEQEPSLEPSLTPSEDSVE